MNSKHLEARLEILTDGSDKTGGAAIFLTIRRCINHVENPDDDDNITSQSFDGDDGFCYQESPQDIDDGTIVARYNLSGVPSLTGRLSSDQSFKLLQNGVFNAVLVPSLVQFSDSDGGTMRGECIGGLPALFLNLIQSGYKIAGDNTNTNQNNKVASTEFSSDSSVDCEKIACADIRYNNVSIIGPAGLNDTIDGLLDTMFGNFRRRPSLRLCEVPSDDQWYEVYEDSYVCIWAQSLPHDTSKSTCLCQTCPSNSKEPDASDLEEYSLAFVVTLRPQVRSNNNEYQRITKRQKTTSRSDQFRPYSFGIMTQPTPSFQCKGTCQKCGTKNKRIINSFQTWDAFRNLPQEIASKRNQSSFVLDFILHLNPSFDEKVHHEKKSMDQNKGDVIMHVEERKINVPSWMVDAKLAQHYLALFPTDTLDTATDKGLLIRAWHRSKVLHHALPFAFPLNTNNVARQEYQNPDKVEEHVSGVSTVNALKLSSCTSVTLNGWGSMHCHDRFEFLSRSNAVRRRCHERIFANWNKISLRDNKGKEDFAKMVESLNCAFWGGSCYCDGCDGMEQQNTADDNEIDLDDSSCEDEDIQPSVTEEGAVLADLSSTSTTIDVNSAHLIFLGTGCATPSPHRSSSGIGLLMPTSNYGTENSSHTAALALSAIIECGEGTLRSLSRHIQSFSDELSSLDNQLSHVNFIWISHSHLDHYGDLSSVVQAVANAKRKVKTNRPVVVIAPPKVLKYLRVMLGKSLSLKGRNRLYIGITHRDFQASPFAGHERSMIYDDRLMMSSSSHLHDGRQARKSYKPFVSIQNIEVEHCRDAYALLLELCIPTKNGAFDTFSLCFSGDTRPSSTLTKACLVNPSSVQRQRHSPISLLIHEATFLDDPHGRGEALRKKHSTVREALDVATSMKAEACILTHFSQRYPHVSADDVSPADTKKSYPGNWGIACDGMMIPLTQRGMASLLPLTRCIDAIHSHCIHSS